MNSFKIGDYIEIDNEKYVIDGFDSSSDYFFLKKDINDTFQYVYSAEMILAHAKKVNNYELPIGSINCLHDWILYEGFSESYNFCKKCDIKKTKV